MDSSYEAYEKACKKEREKNEVYLNDFQKWLKDKGLAEKTIRNHVSNVDFYINDYLCYYEVRDVKEGCYCISEFLGDWFIRKALWSSCAHIKSNAASIKKFYALMLEKGVVDQDDYDSLAEDIKEEMPVWLERMTRFDNMDEDEDDFY